MIKSRLIPQNPPLDLKVKSLEFSNPHPFKVSIISIDDISKLCSISVNANSQVLKSQNILDKLDILGKNLELEFPYGSKVWLETLFDRNREPVLGLIRVGNYWPAMVNNSSGVRELVYPKCEEFISKSDLESKIAEMEGVLVYLDQLKELSAAELLFQKDNGIITVSQYQVALGQADAGFEKRKTSIREYKADLPKFFTAAPSATWKKLFKLYTLIAYTTKDNSAAIPGASAFFSKQGSTTTPAVPQVTPENSYRIVQCAHSDYLLQDSWYNDSYPSKVLVPCPRPVHTFYDGQETEEDKNT